VSQEFKDYYSVLNISFQATEAEIKTAYRKMAREYHPDMHPEEPDVYTGKFQEITEAYETLSEPMKKGFYDLRYRQFVLMEGPQYELVVDDTPPDTREYKHKYTAYRNKRNFSYASVAALIFLIFQVARMVMNAAPLEAESGYDRAYQPLSGTSLPTQVQNRHQFTAPPDSMNFSNSVAPFMDKARH
jgi:curved DNA-binding protein CbpA